MPKQGDLVLIPVPFTDLSSNKQRPVIVISKNEYNQMTQDMVVVALTSNPDTTAHGFTITSADLVKGKLKRPSQIRIDKIYTLAQGLAVRTFGKVNKSVLERISESLQELIEV